MIARNNIFNIRKGAKWKGMTGVRKGFVEFESKKMAMRAWLMLMRTYRRVYGCTTIRQIVTRYAPPNENDTEGYIQYCCRQMDMNPDDMLVFDSEYIQLAAAMARMETGEELNTKWAHGVMEKFNISIVEEA